MFDGTVLAQLTARTRTLSPVCSTKWTAFPMERNEAFATSLSLRSRRNFYETILYIYAISFNYNLRCLHRFRSGNWRSLNGKRQ